jgi:hypothetical protein
VPITLRGGMSGNQTISYDEFLGGLRGELNERRKGLVMQAFAVLDTDGSGEILPQDLVDRYDSSRHPDVIAGRRTAAEVLQEFLETFDVGGVVDGKITKDEFLNYYRNISASIDEDVYFELMIRNAYHISGGEGQAANSANLRVLVTHRDGRQTVEEIKNDLGVAAGNRKRILKRLSEQGINAIDVDVKGGVQSEKKDDGAAETKKPKTLASLHRERKAAVDSSPVKPALTRQSLASSESMRGILRLDLSRSVSNCTMCPRLLAAVSLAFCTAIHATGLYVAFF